MNKENNKTITLYEYINLLCQKLDKHTDFSIQRIGNCKQNDWNQVEFVEKMLIEPLNLQIVFLSQKILHTIASKEVKA